MMLHALMHAIPKDFLHFIGLLFQEKALFVLCFWKTVLALRLELVLNSLQLCIGPFGKIIFGFLLFSLFLSIF
jgi:hypothetical protein